MEAGADTICKYGEGAVDTAWKYGRKPPGTERICAWGFYLQKRLCCVDVKSEKVREMQRENVKFIIIFSSGDTYIVRKDSDRMMGVDMLEGVFLISDAARQVDVPAHVLRYWEEELEMEIPRNEMGHRFYTGAHVRLFRQVKVLKEKGYQLKAIKTALTRSLETGGEAVVSENLLEEDVMEVLMDCVKKEQEEMEKLDNKELTELIAKERAEQFRGLMVQMIGQAIEENNEKLSQDISRMVNEKVVKELDYLMRVADERDEERFRQLDETIRLYQREHRGKAEAAATKVPFLPLKFGRRR